MQPTFLPWLGYFALIASADHFIYLDDVQISRQSWQHRNRLKGPNGTVMMTVPVSRKPSWPDLKDAKVAGTAFRNKMILTAEMCLGQAPYYGMVREFLARNLYAAGDDLCALNISIIDDICNATGINTPRYRASDMPAAKGETRSDRLLHHCRNFGAASYLSPVGAFGYLEEEARFPASGMNLRFQNFRHPDYPQGQGEFLPYMGAIDALSWCGPDNFMQLLQDGTGPTFSLNELKANIQNG